MKTDDIESKEAIAKNLEKFYRDRLTNHLENYTHNIQKKEGGISSGFVGKDADENAFMLKDALTKETDNKNEEIAKNDLIREYIFASLFKRVLYDNTPTIGLAYDKNAAGETDKLYIKSKFIDNFKTYEQYSDSNRKSLVKAEGLEKVIAASILFGDMDFHNENVGIINKGDNDNPKLTFARIDYGKSGAAFKTPLKVFMDQAFKTYENFNVTKLCEALDEVIKNISDDEIEAIIRNRSYELKKQGMKLTSNLAVLVT